MSEKKGNMAHNTSQFLAKKSSRKKKQVEKWDKNIDMKAFKEKMLTEMANFNQQIKFEEIDYSASIKEYEKRYKEYLQEGFSLNCLIFINRVIIESTTIPKELRNHFALHKMIIDIVKQLMMNEFEILYFSMYLDKMGWTSEGYSVEENLLITALSAKLYLNANFEFIFQHLSKTRPNIDELFNRWLNSKKDYCNLMTITPREVNERFKLLSKPSSSYCRQNFIDHNYVVDQILQMSLPYSEANRQIHGETISHSGEESQVNDNVSNYKSENQANLMNAIKNSMNTNPNLSSLTQNYNSIFKDPPIDNTFSNSQDIIRARMPIESKPINQGNIEPNIPYFERSSSNFFEQNLFYQRNSQLFNNVEEDANLQHSFLLKNNMSLKNNACSYTSLQGDNNSPLVSFKNPNWINSQVPGEGILNQKTEPKRDSPEEEQTSVNRVNESAPSQSVNSIDNMFNTDLKCKVLPKMSLAPYEKNKNFLPLLERLKSNTEKGEDEK